MQRAAASRVGSERRDPAATRRALLQAAATLFSERGFDGVPIEDVAARAGVNKALISYHFHGKRGLYVAVLVSVFAEMAARLNAIEAERRDARETLHSLLQAFAGLSEERPDFPTLFIREVLSHGIEPAVVPHLLEIIGVTRRLAERGMREGTFRQVDPLMLHLGLVGSMVFFLATEPARRRAVRERRLPLAMPDFRDFLRYLEELTVRGLAPESQLVPAEEPGPAHPRGLAPDSRGAATPRRKGARV